MLTGCPPLTVSLSLSAHQLEICNLGAIGWLPARQGGSKNFWVNLQCAWSYSSAGKLGCLPVPKGQSPWQDHNRRFQTLVADLGCSDSQSCPLQSCHATSVLLDEGCAEVSVPWSCCRQGALLTGHICAKGTMMQSKSHLLGMGCEPSCTFHISMPALPVIVGPEASLQ